MKRLAIIAVVLAVITSVWTWWPRRAVSGGPAEGEGRLLTSTGEEMSPEKATSLRVATWSAEENGPKVFEVAKRDGEWVIPSHFDYPADGGTRVGTTAGTVLNVPRGPLVTTDIKRHGELGVVDPLEEAAGAEGEGRGKRVTLKDQGGSALVDLVIGGKAEHANVYYVREAGKDAVYTADISPDIRTAFKDWVKTDLLEIIGGDVRSITVLDQSVDERRGVLVTRSNTTFTKGEDDTDWSSANALAGRTVSQDTLGDMVSEITSLTLVGVRPFSNLWLQARGFYVLMDGSLAGNEGSTQIRTKDGLIYHLFFGEIALGDEEDTAAEVEAERPAADEAGAHNRYMAAFVQYLPSLDESLAEAEGEAAAAEESAGAAGGAKADNRKKAEREQRRFGRFFYVISDDSFKKLRPSSKELFKRRT
jgi:hypothetical protein